jgi:putative colanic acid biosynthesis UDP-glucose lipid carrier transferase
LLLVLTRASRSLSEEEWLAGQADRIFTSRSKRAFDFAVALVALVLLLPVLILIGLAIAVDSRGGVFYRQERSGLRRRPFMMFKFRTMRADSDKDGFVQAAANDARTTRVGRFLRRSSLDELPQLLNVLRGDMSIVGPRPHPLPLDEALAERLDRYWDRNLVRPGITGLAQIRGYRGPTASLEAARNRLDMDLAYIRSWSPVADLRILLRTPFCLFGPNAF